MNRREFNACMPKLVEDYQLRWLRKARRYLGLYRGVIIEAYKWEGEIILGMTSPHAQILGQADEKFSGFKNYIDAGLPTEWLTPWRGQIGENGEIYSLQGCAVKINLPHMESMGLDTF